MRYFEDFIEGEEIELGSVSVSQEEIIEFASRFDPKPFHVDPLAAANSHWEGLIASGWHTASLFMRLYVDTVLNDSSSFVSPGIEELKWLRPVRPGDVLSGRFKVLECRPSGSRSDLGIVKSSSRVYNQRGEELMSLKASNFFFRRPE